MLLAVVSLALVAAACGDDSSSQPDDAGIGDDDDDDDDAGVALGPVALAELPAVLTDVVCAFDVRCGEMPDLATCRVTFDPAQTDIGQLASLVASGVLTYDADKAGACLEAYRDAACTRFGVAAGPAPVCDEVFVGDKAENVDCLVDEECAGEMICETAACAAGCCAGVCKRTPDAVALDADCHDAPCGDDAYCAIDDAGGARCVALATAGAACNDLGGCAAGSVCKLGGAGPGMCIALAARGGACDPAIAEPDGGCAGFDDWCDPTTSICAARAAISGACSSDAQCVEAATCQAGACVARPGLGQPCGGNATGGSCLGDLACAVDTCVAAPAVEVCP